MKKILIVVFVVLAIVVNTEAKVPSRLKYNPKVEAMYKHQVKMQRYYTRIQRRHKKLPSFKYESKQRVKFNLKKKK